MATIKDLFKQKEKDLYGTTDMIRIETHGLVNIPRGAALLASSPDTIGDLIGTQVAGIIKGTANRPSDTIFKGSGFFNKPISLGQTQVGLQQAVEPGVEYFVKQHPAPASVIAKIKQGGSSPVGVATNVAISTLNKFGSFKKGRGVSALGKALGLAKSTDADGYGMPDGLPKYGQGASVKKFSTYKEVWETYPGGKKTLEERTSEFKSWDNANDSINGIDSFKDEREQSQYQTTYKHANQVIVTFKKYGNTAIVPFAGTVSGISEDVTPEWSDFKYLGSPFKVYRYAGVERSLKFELKLYYTNQYERDTMIKKINYLKSLTFPYENVSEVIYGKDDSNAGTTSTSQLIFSPNLVYLTIGDLYKNMFGYIDSLSFSIDDTTAWPNFNVNADYNSTTSNTLYPSTITVSVGLKVIENHTQPIGGTVTKYKYDFDGLNASEYYTIADEEDKSEKLKPMVARNSGVTSNQPNTSMQLQFGKSAKTPAYTTSPEGFNSDSKYLSVGNRTFK